MDLDSIKEVILATETVLSEIAIAEEEIESAQKRHGEPVGENGVIWRSFRLLRPTHPLMSTEFIFRQHCRELLDRVAADLDTTAATGAELVLAICEASQVAPLTGSATGLYFKLLTTYFPEQAHVVFQDFDRTVDDYLRMYGDRMADDELRLRRKLRKNWRIKE